MSQDGRPETILESILKIIKELNGKPTPLTSKPQLTCSKESNTPHSSVFLPEAGVVEALSNMAWLRSSPSPQPHSPVFKSPGACGHE